MGLFIVSCSDETIPEENDYSPYIHKVFDFCPAVGQFTNELPVYKPGDTKDSMIVKANKALAGANPSMVSLGGFGGYIVFGFDHTVENVKGKRDFRVLGNAFWSDANPNNTAEKGGSCEPGIIMVSYDANKNGIPDDEWYEIAGSAYNESVKDYEITYYKPDPSKAPVPGEEKWQKDIEYIKWEDNKGNSGYKTHTTFHLQSYFPKWITEDKITFKGTLLPNNAVNEGSKEESYWVLYAYDWGYADNYPNNKEGSAIDIDWAVDKNGNKANLPGITFVKVYTGINQEAGRIGEVSTEITGAVDLHLLGK